MHPFPPSGLNRQPRRQITLSLTLHYQGSVAAQPIAVQVSTSAHCRCRPGCAGAKLTAFIGRHPSPPTTTRVRARTAHVCLSAFPNLRGLFAVRHFWNPRGLDFKILKSILFDPFVLVRSRAFAVISERTPLHLVPSLISGTRSTIIASSEALQRSA
jgi:hypothetical protein